MTSEHLDVADYSNEDSSKILDVYALIEAIHEYFEPTADHDADYLNKRISLLRGIFNLEQNSTNANANVIDQLLSGYGQLQPLQVLPFDDASEVPNTLDTEAHTEVYKQFASRIDQIRASVREIHRAYITYIIIHAVEARLRSKTTTLAELIAKGLPEFDPGTDGFDY
jgi:hypothetical protein